MFDEKKYQFKLCKFLIDQRKKHKRGVKNTVIFKLKDFPKFDEHLTDEENMEEFKKEMEELIEEEIVLIKNPEVLKNLDILTKNYLANNEIKIKYDRLDVEKFLERANPEQLPDILYLKKFEEDNKIKIYYNKKEVGFKFYSIRGALCMLMFGDEIKEVERDKDFDPEDYNDDKEHDGYNENCDYSYKVSIKLIYKDYKPYGEKKVNIKDLTCLIYYQADLAKIDKADKKEKVMYNDRIYGYLLRINEIAKRKEKLGIDLFSVVKSGKFSHDGKVKLKKLCKILDSETDS
ncbi:hypothetical protein KKA66_02060 [Patescibacteria group bacterium]|nr:hypothetical protein [Patescibacteria group bacterium]